MNFKNIVFIKEEIKYLESIVDWCLFGSDMYDNPEAFEKIASVYEKRILAWKKELERQQTR